MATPSTDDLDIQGAWDPVPLREQWPMGLDNYFIMKRLMQVPVEETLRGASGRVLEVAAAEAVHSCRLAGHGLACHVLEPSEGMLAKAREHMAEYGVQLQLVRGIAEALPYPDASFDRVLIDSAMDHLAAPDTGLREMIRVLKPEGRLLISFVNYSSLAVRLSRAVYAVERRLRPAARREGRFWDSPVPVEHTFECTYRNIGALCGQYLELDRALGVSMLWGTPGWAGLLRRLDRARAERLMEALDGVAQRMPGLADFVLTVWRPRRVGEIPGNGLRAQPRLARVAGATPQPPPPHLAQMRITPADPIYPRRKRDDDEWEERWGLAPIVASRLGAARPWDNRALTGDARRSGIDELAARGPFEHALLIGQATEDEAAIWLQAAGSRRLEIVEDNPARLARVRARLTTYGDRVRFIQQDPNFLQLRPGAYDIVVAASGIGRVVNLEYMLDEIARGLRPGGLLGLNAYVGERRQAYAAARLALVNAALAQFPARFRHGVEDVTPAEPDSLAPFRAVRSDEIVGLAKARFQVLEERYGDRLFPIRLYLDIAALEREAPERLEELLAHERSLADNPSATPCTAYLVLQKPA